MRFYQDVLFLYTPQSLSRPFLLHLHTVPCNNIADYNLELITCQLSFIIQFTRKRGEYRAGPAEDLFHSKKREKIRILISKHGLVYLWTIRRWRAWEGTPPSPGSDLISYIIGRSQLGFLSLIRSQFLPGLDPRERPQTPGLQTSFLIATN